MAVARLESAKEPIGMMNCSLGANCVYKVRQGGGSGRALPDVSDLPALGTPGTAGAMPPFFPIPLRPRDRRGYVAICSHPVF